MAATAGSWTGFWTGVFFGATAAFCALRRGEAPVDAGDRAILHRLAGRVRRIADRPREREKRELWYGHNALRERYPVILCDPENGWNEIITEDQLECAGSLARRWEWVLRRQVFWGETLLDDRPIEPVFEVGTTHADTGWGIDAEHRGGGHGGSYAWTPAITKPADIDKISIPRVDVDRETTLGAVDLARSVFDGVLEVITRGPSAHSAHLTRDLAKMVGLENMMVLMYDDPGFLHAIMKRFLSGHQRRLDDLETNGLLGLNNDWSYVGSGGIGYCRELPRRKLDPGVPVRTEDLWLHDESQESVGVSPEMFAEIIYPYQAPLHARFGMSCYGCCEPLESRWHVVKNIPHLRRVSVSAWADERKMAGFLGDRFIYSRKPNPAVLATPVLNEEAARDSLRATLEGTRDGCIVELVMKDNHTIGRNPRNVVRWVEIAREEVERLHGTP
jgi:hypothetical protein